MDELLSKPPPVYDRYCWAGNSKSSKHKLCRSPAVRMWDGIPVCAIHDPDGNHVKKHPEFRDAFIKRLQRARLAYERENRV